MLARLACAILLWPAVTSGAALNKELAKRVDAARLMVGGTVKGSAALRKLCAKPIPGFARGINFKPLETPPEGARTWVEWIRENAAELMDSMKALSEKSDEFNREAKSITSNHDKANMCSASPNAWGFSASTHSFASPIALLEALENPSASVNIPSVFEMPALQKTIRLLDRALGRPTNGLDFYVAGVGAESFGWHYDHDEDVIVYCVEGIKRFQVSGYYLDDPISVNVTMEPGDAVFIPSYTYHRGSGAETPSVILSIGLPPLPSRYTDRMSREDINKKGEREVDDMYQKWLERGEPPW